MTRTLDQTVALAVVQAARLSALIPETQAIVALRDHPEARSLLAWMDGAPPTIAANRDLLNSQISHVARMLASLIPLAPEPFWEEYMRQRTEGRIGSDT